MRHSYSMTIIIVWFSNLPWSRSYKLDLPGAGCFALVRKVNRVRNIKGQPPDTLPSLMQSKLRTIGGSRLTLCDSGPSTSASWPTRPNSTAPTANSKAPSSPETNAEDGWSVHDFPSGFRIWQENQHACLQVNGPTGDGRRDEDVTSKRQCDVIDLTNEDSSSDEEEL